MAVLGKLVAVGLGGLGGLTGVLYASTVLSDSKAVVQASQKITDWKNKRFENDSHHIHEPAKAHWDYNWDRSLCFSVQLLMFFFVRMAFIFIFCHRRDPSHMVSPSKGGEDDIRHRRDLEIVEPKAVRHLLLIRHGQYNLDGATDKEMILTTKGKHILQFHLISS